MRGLLGLPLFLAACGGASAISTRDAAAPPPIDPPGIVLSDTTFEGAAKSLELRDGGALSSGASFSSWFVNEDTLILTVENRTILLLFDGFNQYKSEDGSASLFFSRGPVDGAIDADVVALTFVETPDAGAPRSIYNFVTGVETSPAALAGFGRASYTGQGHFWNTDANVSVAQVTLNVQFDAATIDGTFRQAIANAPSVTLTLPETDIVGGQFAGSLTSADVGITSSAVSGGFYGENARSVAGTANADTDLGPITGYFIATR